MSKVIRRVLVLGFIGPALLTPVVVLGRRGYEWWHNLVAIVGGGYLIPVFGTLAGWKLVAMSRKAGRAVSFAVRGLVGMILMSAVLLVVTPKSLEEIGSTARWLFLSEGLVILVVVGLLYAAQPLVGQWLRCRQQRGQEPRKPA